MSYPLYEGPNIIGRYKPPAPANGVVIEQDSYVSRAHCCLIISRRNNQWIAELSDDGQWTQGKPSTNGTFVNGNARRVIREIIGEHDTIQAGNTKLVFRWKESRRTADLEDEVRQTGFVKTVIINI